MTLDAMATRLQSAKRVALTTHAKPDGDAIGSSLGLARALHKLGIEAELWYIPPVPPSYQSLLPGVPVYLVENYRMPPESCDTIVITDTSAWSQLEPMKPYLQKHRDRVLVIDHHLQGDDVTDHKIVQADAGSACEIIADLVQCMGVSLTAEIATPLYLGIATDTGWFRFSNVSSRTFQCAARLLEAGANHTHLYALSEQTDRSARLRLLAAALGSIEFFHDDQFALMTLRLDDYDECDATTEESHGFADLPHCVEAIKVVCLMAESRAGGVKLSLRSKAGPTSVDVNKLAGNFGGGGHACASGAKIRNGTLESVRKRLLEVFDQLV